MRPSTTIMLNVQSIEFSVAYTFKLTMYVNLKLTQMHTREFLFITTKYAVIGLNVK